MPIRRESRYCWGGCRVGGPGPGVRFCVFLAYRFSSRCEQIPCTFILVILWTIVPFKCSVDVPVQHARSSRQASPSIKVGVKSILVNSVSLFNWCHHWNVMLS